MGWTAITTFVLDQLFGYQSANFLKNNHIAIMSGGLGRSLGGSRDVPNNPVIPLRGGVLRSKQSGTGPFDVVNYIDVEIDGTNQSGITIQARVEVRTNKSSCTITPKIRNITDSTDAGTGVACAAGRGDYSGTNQKQTIAVTVASGVKKYRLQFTLSDNRPDLITHCIGELERIATA